MGKSWEVWCGEVWGGVVWGRMAVFSVLYPVIVGDDLYSTGRMAVYSMCCVFSGFRLLQCTHAHAQRLFLKQHGSELCFSSSWQGS